MSEKDAGVKTIDRETISATGVGSVRASGKMSKRQVLAGVLEEAKLVHFRVCALAEKLHEGGESSGPRRALLANLADLGPRSVPELARMRPVSRQFIQKHVDGLVTDGLVELIENPAHKRSKRVRITARGRRMHRTMVAAEEPMARFLERRLSAAELRSTHRTLRKVRDLLDDLGAVGRD